MATTVKDIIITITIITNTTQIEQNHSMTIIIDCVKFSKHKSSLTSPLSLNVTCDVFVVDYVCDDDDTAFLFRDDINIVSTYT